jgi:serine/threonine protein kinase
MIVDTTLQPGTVLEQRYGVIRELSVGETYRVYEGRQTNLGQRIVIKSLRELYQDPIQAKQQLEQVALEARILAALSHPNLLAVYDCFQRDGLPILVSEFVEGRRLSEVVEIAPRPISARRVLSWVEQLLDVLSYLHSQDPPIIVRDLKPSNVILGRDGRLRLVDFSLAKRMHDSGAGTQEIVKGLGADGYAPLEQTAYARTAPATDLYALGATLYFLLTGDHPPTAAQRAIAVKEPMVDPRQKNSTVSPELWAAIQSLMAIRLQERPQSVAAARDLLFPRVDQEPEVSGRRCPDCQIRLDVLTRQQVEIDQCASCGGIWLDRHELERLIELSIEDWNAGAAGPRALTQELEKQVETIRLDDIELPASNKVWQFLRDVLGRSR